MHDMEFHRLLFTIDTMLAWMVEVELDEMELLPIQNDELPHVGIELDLVGMIRVDPSTGRLLPFDSESPLSEVGDVRIGKINRRLLWQTHGEALSEK